MSKYTPGPWKAKNGEVFSKSGKGICVPYSISNQDEANARLIAAAPEMLGQLKLFQQYYETYSMQDMSASVLKKELSPDVYKKVIYQRKKISNLIAKVEGKS